MRIGIPKEWLTNETRVAATPKTVVQLIKLGFTVAIEHEAGVLAGFSDELFIHAGAHMLDKNEIWQSPIILKVNAPQPNEIDLMNPGTTLISFIWPKQNPELMTKLAAHNITVIAMDLVPRISRAQSMDALSSMANIAGYRAIIEAAHEFNRFLGGQITAAGKIFPAKIMVIGAGVAGLAAIGVAKSLGAIVYAFDARPEVKEQVLSMGAEFLELNYKEDTATSDKHIQTASDAFIKAEMSLFATKAQEVDIIITTASTPDQSSPILITRDIVDSMNPGSIIVDLAARNGGNCEYTVTNQITKTKNGVKIIGYTDLSVLLPTQASQLYSTNLVNLIKLICKNQDGAIIIDFNDVVIRCMTAVYAGKITWPAPSIKISAQPKTEIAVNQEVKKVKYVSPWLKYPIIIMITVLFGLLVDVVPTELLSHFTIFVLSCIVGYYVIWNIPHALHTPLMSVTNAISGVIIIGAMLQIGYGGWISFLSFIAVLITSINIFSGFTLTQRMFRMFYKGKRS